MAPNKKKGQNNTAINGEKKLKTKKTSNGAPKKKNNKQPRLNRSFIISPDIEKYPHNLYGYLAYSVRLGSISPWAFLNEPRWY
jgi:hypothetical protein